MLQVVLKRIWKRLGASFLPVTVLRTMSLSLLAMAFRSLTTNTPRMRRVLNIGEI